MQSYIKRGVQGRWKDTVDGLGEQYDPRAVFSSLNQTMNSTASTSIIVLDDEAGHWTMRTDSASMDETKEGSTTVGPY